MNPGPFGSILPTNWERALHIKQSDPNTKGSSPGVHGSANGLYPVQNRGMAVAQKDFEGVRRQIGKVGEKW